MLEGAFPDANSNDDLSSHGQVTLSSEVLAEGKVLLNSERFGFDCSCKLPAEKVGTATLQVTLHIATGVPLSVHWHQVWLEGDKTHNGSHSFKATFALNASVYVWSCFATDLNLLRVC